MKKSPSRIITIFLFFCLAFAFPPLAISQTAKIVNGTEVQRGKYPWAAQVIEVSRFEGYVERFAFCSGTLISSNWIVTAAHCLTTGEDNKVMESSEIEVGLGYVDENSSYGAYYSVAEVVVHPDYDPVFGGNDIALINLSQTVEYETISLPDFRGEIERANNANDSSFSFPPNDGEVTLAGWGITAYNTLDLSSVLLETTLEIVSPHGCDLFYAIDEGRPDYTFCAGGEYSPGTDTCQGDSGGGAYITDIITSSDSSVTSNLLAGITSYGVGCAHGVPGVYTDVQYFVDWIEQYVPDVNIVSSVPENTFGNEIDEPILADLAIGVDQKGNLQPSIYNMYKLLINDDSAAKVELTTISGDADLLIVSETSSLPASVNDVNDYEIICESTNPDLKEDSCMLGSEDIEGKTVYALVRNFLDVDAQYSLRISQDNSRGSGGNSGSDGNATIGKGGGGSFSLSFIFCFFGLLCLSRVQMTLLREK